MTVAIFGLVGVVIGSLLNYLLQRSQDLRGFKREDEYRDYHERRQAYAEFVASTDLLFSGEDRSSAAWQEYRRCDGIVRIIAPEAVERAADKVGYVARGSASGSARGVSNAEYGAAKTGFFKAVREDLGKPALPTYEYRGGF